MLREDDLEDARVYNAQMIEPPYSDIVIISKPISVQRLADIK